MNRPIVNVDLAALELSMGTLTDGKPTDTFKAEASKIFGVPEDQVTEDQRRFVKHQAYIAAYMGKS